MKVLIVARAGAMRNGLCTLLAALSPGVEIDVADDQSCAAEAIQVAGHELVLLDPSLSFDELLQTVGAIKYLQPQTRCIVIVEQNRQAQSVMNAGADEVICKGFTADQLLALVNKNTLQDRV